MTTANYPSILSHKGTLIRLRIAYSNGERITIEPLRYEAGGLILNATKARHLIDLPSGTVVEHSALLRHDGGVACPFKVPDDPTPVEFSSFAVYPDGSTFEGQVLKGSPTPALIIWSTELVRLMRSDSDKRAFVADHWTSVPTIVAFFDTTLQPMCPRIEHTCQDCDFITKEFVDLRL